MQLDGATDAQHAGGSIGLLEHAEACLHAAHQRSCNMAVASSLPPFDFSFKAECPPDVVVRRPPPLGIQTRVEPGGQQLARQEQGEDLRSPLPEALLTAKLLPALAVKQPLRHSAQRTQPDSRP